MRSGGTAEKNGKRREKVRVSCQSRAPAGTQRVPGPAGAADMVARRYTAALPGLPTKGSIRFHNVYHVEPSIPLSGRGHRLLCRGLRRRPTAPPERHGVRSIQAGETSLDGAAVLRQGAVLSRIVRTAGCMAGNAGRDRRARLRRPQHRTSSSATTSSGHGFPSCSTWGIKFALEVGALKPWGTTGEKTFTIERPMWDRIERLGGSIYAIAMDEPLCCARKEIHKPDDYAVRGDRPLHCPGPQALPASADRRHRALPVSSPCRT